MISTICARTASVCFMSGGLLSGHPAGVTPHSMLCKLCHSMGEPKCHYACQHAMRRAKQTLQNILVAQTWKNSARALGDAAMVGGASLPPPARWSELVSRTSAANVVTA